MGMALRVYRYFATGNPARIDWHASTPRPVADFLANNESEIGNGARLFRRHGPDPPFTSVGMT
jgi:hypothetical protein